MLVVFRAWAQSLAVASSTPDAIEAPTDAIAEAATDAPTDVAPDADTAGSAGRALMLHLPGVTLVCVDTANHALAFAHLRNRALASASRARCS